MDEQLRTIIKQLFDAHKKMIFAYTNCIKDVTLTVVSNAEMHLDTVDSKVLLEMMKLHKELLESLMNDFEKIGQ